MQRSNQLSNSDIQTVVWFGLCKLTTYQLMNVLMSFGPTQCGAWLYFSSYLPTYGRTNAGHFNGFAGQIMKVIKLLYLLIIKIITHNIVQASEYTKKINQLYYQFLYEEAFV